jgi:hypothetical protein
MKNRYFGTLYLSVPKKETLNPDKFNIKSQKVIIDSIKDFVEKTTIKTRKTQGKKYFLTMVVNSLLNLVNLCGKEEVGKLIDSIPNTVIIITYKGDFKQEILTMIYLFSRKTSANSVVNYQNIEIK